jgi:hypothetical protein
LLAVGARRGVAVAVGLPRRVMGVVHGGERGVAGRGGAVAHGAVELTTARRARVHLQDRQKSKKEMGC